MATIWGDGLPERLRAGYAWVNDEDFLDEMVCLTTTTTTTTTEQEANREANTAGTTGPSNTLKIFATSITANSSS